MCLGYPFHPPKKPDQLRTAHLEQLACPALIVQGERDPFGTRAEVEAMRLSPAIRLHWAGDGDHDLGPRGASGFTRKGNLAAAADAMAEFAQGARVRPSADDLRPRRHGLRLRQALRQHQHGAEDDRGRRASTRNSASKPQFS